MILDIRESLIKNWKFKQKSFIDMTYKIENVIGLNAKIHLLENNPKWRLIYADFFYSNYKLNDMILPTRDDQKKNETKQNQMTPAVSITSISGNEESYRTSECPVWKMLEYLLWKCIQFWNPNFLVLTKLICFSENQKLVTYSFIDF